MIPTSEQRAEWRAEAIEALGRPVSTAPLFASRIMDLVPALDAAEAERDTALARIEKVRHMHRKTPICEVVDDCPDSTDGHADAHHFESDMGEWVCDANPLGYTCAECSEDRDEPGEYPCATLRALDGEVE